MYDRATPSRRQRLAVLTLFVGLLGFVVRPVATRDPAPAPSDVAGLAAPDEATPGSPCGVDVHLSLSTERLGARPGPTAAVLPSGPVTLLEFEPTRSPHGGGAKPAGTRAQLDHPRLHGGPIARSDARRHAFTHTSREPAVACGFVSSPPTAPPFLRS